MSKSKARRISELVRNLLLDDTGDASFTRGVTAETVEVTGNVTADAVEVAGNVTADAVSTSGDITVGGTVDGRDVAADGAKLDGIEAGATADQTGAEIKALYEAELNTNAFTDAEKTKLAGIESGATGDQTASEILAALVTVDGAGSSLDADTLDGKQLSTIESEYQAYANTAASTAAASLVDAAPTTLNTLNELAAALGDDPNFATTVTNSIATKLSLSGGTMTGDITFSGTQLFDGRDLSVDGAKLDGIEAGADVTDTVNVTAAGALMDSELTNIGAVKELNQGVSTTNSPTFSGLTLTGNLYASGVSGLNAANYLGWSNNAYLDVVVNGGIRARVESDGDFHADGDVVAYSTTISDPRLKSDIQKIEGALDKLCTLSGYTFTYTPDNTASAGVLSTEVAKVLPSAIRPKKLPLKTGDEETVYDTVQYDQLHGLLIEAIKELREEVADLKAKIEG